MAVKIDGRRLRREHNREAVIDALVDLFEEGDYSPSTDEVAARAGISPRSLFRYFEDVDDLRRAAVNRQLVAAQPFLELGVTPNAPTAVKVKRLVEGRVAMHRTLAPTARAARIAAHRSPVIAEQLQAARAFFGSQVSWLFSTELAGRHPDLLPAVDVLCSFETHEYLRVANGMSPRKTASALTAALTGLIGGDE